MSTPMDNVLSLLPNAKQHGKNWQALCPAHDDKKASLSISEGDGGRVLLHCHAGCDTSTIVESLGLKIGDLFPDTKPRPKTTKLIVATYDYVDESGTLVFQSVRYQPKDFRQRRPDGKDGWIWDMADVTKIPYHLPQLLAAIQLGEPVFIVEGEKDVHTCKALGLTATCNAGGAGKWQESHSELLERASVVILPDNDKPGQAHAQDVARKTHGIAASVKVIELPGLPPKSDASDWIAAGHTREELLTLVESAPEWIPSAVVIDHEPATRDFHLTDIGNAERLIAAHGDNLRFDVASGKWLIWTGKRWESDNTGEISRRAMSTVRSLYDLLKDAEEDRRKTLFAFISKSESAPRLEAMVKLAQVLPGVAVQATELDHDPWFLNCLNGTIDLRSGTLRPHTREDLITKLAPVEYDPHAQATRFSQFLEEVFQNNAEIIGFVKRMAGYALTGDTREECAFILTGKGQNGKSKLVEALRGVLGDYGANTPFTTFTERHDSNTSDLASLLGLRFVTASEGEAEQSFNESVLKTLTGNDPITCRHLYREYFSYIPTFKIVFSTNEVPKIRSQNYAMKRRLYLIPFSQRFYDPSDNREPVKDDKLSEKLQAEKNGILAWCVQGCLDWQRRGLDTPAVIKQEVDKLFESQDALAEFLESQCEITPGAEVESGALWQHYLLWCEQNARKPAYKYPPAFSRSLVQRDGIDSKKGTGGVRLLSGIGLLDSQSETTFEAESGGSGGKTLFPVNLPMKEVIEIVSEKPDLPPLTATIERETNEKPPKSPCSKCGAAVDWHAYLNGGGFWYVCNCGHTANDLRIDGKAG